jgi:hypothetical protein
MNEFEYYTYEVNRETGNVYVYGWTRSVGSPWKNYIERFDNLKDALDLVGGSQQATPSLQNGTYRPGIPLLDQ